MFEQLHNLFPKLETFPTVRTNGKIAVVIRLFPHNDASIGDRDLSVLNIALWSMRSHILGSDFRKFQAKPIFHVKQAFYETASEILLGAGVPSDSIIAFPDDLCATNVPNATHHWKAAAPILDRQLEQFEHVVVLDGDCFSLKPEYAPPLNLLDLSLNTFPSNLFTIFYDWYTPIEIRLKAYIKFWSQPFGLEKFIEIASHWCECAPSQYRDIMLNPDVPKPLANALYINLPMRWLSQNSEFRGFIHDCSADIGNEEIALHIWSLRHFFKTGEKLPKDSLSRHVTAAHDFNSVWRQYRGNDRACFLHALDITGIRPYAKAFLTSIGATPGEIEQLSMTDF